jgi:hypothetical protein
VVWELGCGDGTDEIDRLLSDWGGGREVFRGWMAEIEVCGKRILVKEAIEKYCDNILSTRQHA